MQRNYITRFYAAPDDKAGAIEDMMGEEPDLDPQSGEIVEDPIEVEVPEVDPAKSDAPVVVPSFTPEALAAAFKAAGIGAAQPPVQATAQPKLTAEEVKKQLKYWEPTKDWVTKFDNLETRDAALAEMVQGQSEHAYTLARAQAEEMKRELMTQFEPVLTAHQQAQDEKMWNKFGTKYPALSKPELRPVLASVLSAISASGYRPTGEDDIFDKLAQGALPVIQQFNPQFTLTAKAAVATQQNNGRGKTIPTTTPGGGGANGGTSGGTPSRTSAIKSLFK